MGHYLPGYCQDLHFTDEASQAQRGQGDHQRPNKVEGKSKGLFAPRPPTVSCCKNLLNPNEASADLWAGQSASNQGKHLSTGK